MANADYVWVRLKYDNNSDVIVTIDSIHSTALGAMSGYVRQWTKDEDGNYTHRANTVEKGVFIIKKEVVP